MKKPAKKRVAKRAAKKQDVPRFPAASSEPTKNSVTYEVRVSGLYNPTAVVVGYGVEAGPHWCFDCRHDGLQHKQGIFPVERLPCEECFPHPPGEKPHWSPRVVQP